MILTYRKLYFAFSDLKYEYSIELKNEYDLESALVEFSEIL